MSAASSGLETGPSQLESRLGLALTVLGVALYPLLLWRGWGAWNDVLVDYGRELYVPWRLLEGEVLYRDVAYFNGPLSPYWNAAVFGVLGVSLRSLTIANAVLTAVTGWLLHRRLRSVGGPLSAGAGLVAFVVVFACGRFPGVGNYNFLAPYSHELTHGLLLALLAFEAALRGVRAGGARWAALSGLLLGLVFLTKAEVMLAATGALVWLFALSWKSSPTGSLRPLALALGASLLAPFVACLALMSAMPFDEALAGTLGTWAGIFGSQASELLFYDRTMGVDAAATNFGAMFSSLGYVLLFLVPAIAVDRWTRSLRTPKRLVAALACGVAAATLMVFEERSLEFWFYLIRFLPLVALGAVAFATWRALLGKQSEREGWSERSAFAVFGLALMAKILLLVTVAQYGFALALVGALVFVVICLDWLPKAVGGAELPGAALRMTALGLFGGVAFAHAQLSGDVISSLTVEVGSGPDAFKADPLRGQGVQLLLKEVDERMGQEQSLLVLPEGILVNYLARRRTPTRHINFMPPELELFGEEQILAELRAEPAAALALVHKDTSEYGFPLFGIDYGQKIIRWAQRRYQYDWNWGDQPLQPGTRFGVGFLGPK